MDPHSGSTSHGAPYAEPQTGPEGDGPEADEAHASVLSSAESVLDAVDAALARLDDGTYGICEHCGGRIEADVMEADPTAGLCERHLAGGAE